MMNTQAIESQRDCLGNIKKDVGWKRPGAATGEFYCALNATLTVSVRLSLFLGRVWEMENGRGKKCMSWRTWWGNKASQSGRRVWAVMSSGCAFWNSW